MEAIDDPLLKADEVDTPTLPVKEVLQPHTNPSFELTTSPGLDTIDLQETGADGSRDQMAAARPIRPILRRDKSLPPPQQPPPPAPPQPVDEPDTPTDSISLIQLKKLVAEFPKVEPTPYAFTYQDKSSLEEEIEEFMAYSEEERAKLSRTQAAFTQQWRTFIDSEEHGASKAENNIPEWHKADVRVQRRFLERLRSMLVDSEGSARSVSLTCLVYIALGCWGETAGLEDEEVGIGTQHNGDFEDGGINKVEEGNLSYQMTCMQKNVRLLFEVIGPRCIFEAARPVGLPLAKSEGSEAFPAEDQSGTFSGGGRRTSWAVITLMYVSIEVALLDSHNGSDMARQSLLNLDPNLLNLLTDWLAESRWDDSSGVPSSKLLLLYWKTILLTFGGIVEVDEIRKAYEEAEPEHIPDGEQPRITASPLDYHMFRQEIISKYPAFNPPQPLFPFDPEHNSILPPYHDYNDRPDEDFGRPPGAGAAGVNGASILHQPVHIATPAPSPPPSPAGPGGKGIKKQNYQTNQMFPFLYPPLEESSNDLGGKGSTALQDLLVGRKWQGSDIPTSILEAANLFAQRMKATQAMKQLWAERVRFMKYERGFGSLNSSDDQEDSGSGKPKSTGLSDDLQSRLDAVEEFYKRTLPSLQSVVVVLVKVLLQTVTTLVTQTSMSNGSPNGLHPLEQEVNFRPRSEDEPNGSAGKTSDPSLQEVDRIRSQEIMGKAVSGIFILLLKWFKISHVLKFEYLTQLLLDSNYVQLTLKLFTHQELDRVVGYKTERKELNFFQWCKSQANNDKGNASAEAHTTIPDSPPKPTQSSPELEKEQDPQAQHQPPSVDELGLPTASLPTTPITTFSWRALFTTINHLRTLQKLIKSKPHRQLLMVQLKYSNILKKALKVPQPDVRLYTLKIIKGQVPYCHRKWRQGNMRVITAIYLHCRPSLRDEWLAGCDIDQEVGEALPQERALRALTYWYNLRRYPREMGMAGPPQQHGTADEGVKGEGDDGDESLGPPTAVPVGTMRHPLEAAMEPDFFLQELERMDLGRAAYGGDGQGEEEMGGEGGAAGGEAGRWEGPMQMEGW